MLDLSDFQAALTRAFADLRTFAQQATRLQATTLQVNLAPLQQDLARARQELGRFQAEALQRTVPLQVETEDLHTGLADSRVALQGFYQSALRQRVPISVDTRGLQTGLASGVQQLLAFRSQTTQAAGQVQRFSQQVQGLRLPPLTVNTVGLQTGLASGVASLLSFQRRVEGLREQLQTIGASAQRLGTQLSVAVSAPLGVATGAVLKFGANFETSLTRLHTLSGVAREDLSGLRTEILTLSQISGRGPQELADALLIVTSTGLRGAQAMSVLERATKGSVAGFGPIKDLARTLTAAMLTYADSGLTAARAMDILAVSAEAGGAEVDQLAPLLGRVLGPAKAAGISLEELGAFLATLTRLGVPADEAITSLGATINALLTPGEDARQVLRSIGMTASDLARSLRERGLTATLRTLNDELGGNVTAINRVIPNIRALRGVLGTAGAQGEEFDAILRQITASSGALDAKVVETQQTTTSAFAEMVAGAQRFATEVGTAFNAPAAQLSRLATQLLTFATGLARTFGALPTPIRTAVLGLTGLTVALGPLLLGFSQLLRLLPALVAAFPALLAFLGPHGLLVAGVLATIAVLGLLALKIHEVINAVPKTPPALELQTRSAEQRLAQLSREMAALEGQIQSIQRSGSSELVREGRLRAPLARLQALKQEYANVRTELEQLQRAQAQGTTPTGAAPPTAPAPPPGGRAARTPELQQAVDQALRDLTVKLGDIRALRQLNEQFDAGAAKVSAYTEAVQTLLKEGLTPADPELQQLARQLAAARAESEAFGRARAATDLLRRLPGDLRANAAEFQLFGDAAAATESRMQLLRQAMSSLLQASVSPLAPQVRTLKQEFDALEISLRSLRTSAELGDILRTMANQLSDAAEAFGAALDTAATPQAAFGARTELLQSQLQAVEQAMGRIRDTMRDPRLFSPEHLPALQQALDGLSESARRLRRELTAAEMAEAWRQLTLEMDAQVRLLQAEIAGAGRARQEREALLETERLLAQWRATGLPETPEALAGLRAYAAEVARLQEQLRGLRDPLQEFLDASEPIWVQLRQGALDALASMEEALVQFWSTGKLGFSDFVNAIQRDLLRMLTRQLITQPLVEGLRDVFHVAQGTRRPDEVGGAAATVGGGIGRVAEFFQIPRLTPDAVAGAERGLAALNLAPLTTAGTTLTTAATTLTTASTTLTGAGTQLTTAGAQLIAAAAALQHTAGLAGATSVLAPTGTATPVLEPLELARDIVDFLPGLAGGGLVRQPTVAKLGERGAEAVVPLQAGGFLLPPGVSATPPPTATLWESLAPYLQDLLAASRAIFGEQFLTAGPITDEQWLEMVSGGHALGRVGVLAGRERLASDIIKRGLKQPYFHGTGVPAEILARGFQLERVGSFTGHRLGEPAGISLSRDPNVAATFARNAGLVDPEILRVAVDLPPSAVGQFIDPAFIEAYQRAYGATRARLGPELGVNFEQLKTGMMGPAERYEGAMAWFNRQISAALRAEGVEAIAFNPRRYGEFELRVLDPTKAVPLGTLPVPRHVLETYRRNPQALLKEIALAREDLGTMRAALQGGQGIPDWISPARLPQSIAEQVRLLATLERQLGLLRQSPMWRYQFRNAPALRQAYEAAPLSPAHLQEIIPGLQAGGLLLPPSGGPPPPPLPWGETLRPYGMDLVRLGRLLFGEQFLTSGPFTEQEWLEMVSGGHALGRVGVLPGHERLASDIIKRGLRQPYFHGSPNVEAILREGFAAERVGQATGLRLGEPAGISLSRDPRVAGQFARGGDILRVAVDLPPSAVGQFIDPAFIEAYQRAYGAALTRFPELRGMPARPTTGAAIELREALAPAFNQELSTQLRGAGVEAIAMNPRRYGEFELRVLDPSKAVPLGHLNPATLGATTRSPAQVKASLEAAQAELARLEQVWGILEPANRAQLLPQIEAQRGLVNQWQRQYLGMTRDPLYRYFQTRSLPSLARSLGEAPEFPARLRDIIPGLQAGGIIAPGTRVHPEVAQRAEWSPGRQAYIDPARSLYWRTGVRGALGYDPSLDPLQRREQPEWWEYLQRYALTLLPLGFQGWNLAGMFSGLGAGARAFSSGAGMSLGPGLPATGGFGSFGLRAFQHGGILRGPQLVLAGEGPTPEAFIPLQNGAIPALIDAAGRLQATMPAGLHIPIQLAAMQAGGVVNPGVASTVGELRQAVERRESSRPAGRQGPSVVMNVYTPDVGSFRQSANQVTAQVAMALERARKRNG